MTNVKIRRHVFVGFSLIACLLVFTTYTYIVILNFSNFLILKYLCYCLVGVTIMMVANKKPIEYFFSYAYIGYFGILLLLVMVFFAPSINGSHRWLQLGIFNIQPSELVKVIFPLFLCRLDKNGQFCKSKKLTLVALLCLIVTFTLIIMEPDLGTAVFVLLEGLICLVLLRANRVVLFGFFVFFCIMIPVLYMNLKPYQMMRLAVFLNRESVPFEHGFQVMQSMATVVSGGFWGIGSHMISQAEMGSLVHAHTDFIFSMVAQYFGFIGAIISLTVVLSIVWLADSICEKSELRTVYALKKTFIYAIVLAIMINCGMNLALIPAVGLSFPILSFGGSNFIVSCFMLGCIFNKDWKDLYA